MAINVYSVQCEEVGSWEVKCDKQLVAWEMGDEMLMAFQMADSPEADLFSLIDYLHVPIGLFLLFKPSDCS